MVFHQKLNIYLTYLSNGHLIVFSRENWQQPQRVNMTFGDFDSCVYVYLNFLFLLSYTKICFFFIYHHETYLKVIYKRRAKKNGAFVI